MNFEFISSFESFSVRRIWLAPLYRCSSECPIFPRYAAARLRGKLTVAFNWWRHQSSVRWSWAEADQIQIEIGEFEFLFRESKRKEFDEEKFLNFFNLPKKNMRNHLWVIWWVILLLNLLVGDWWWIIAMIRQLNCLIKSAEEQNS